MEPRILYKLPKTITTKTTNQS